MRAVPKIIALAAASLSLAACATYSPLAGNSGPTATVADSFDTQDSSTCASFFILQQYDGHEIDNALAASTRASAGAGFHLTAKDTERQIPAHEATVHLIGRTHCAAPIQEMVKTVYLIQGDIRFSPASGSSYVVTGELAPDHSAVWIEDKSTHVRTGNKLLIKGAAKVGFISQSTTPEQVPPGSE